MPPLLGSGKVNVLTLIGSSKVADQLKKLHPKINRLRAILGLDAKNAAIVLPDADIDLAVDECLLGALSFNGPALHGLEDADGASIHRRALPAPLHRETRQAEGRHAVGRGREHHASARAGQTAYMAELIEDAKAKGARVVNEGGGTSCATLFYPAVVYPSRNR